MEIPKDEIDLSIEVRFHASFSCPECVTGTIIISIEIQFKSWPCVLSLKVCVRKTNK